MIRWSLYLSMSLMLVACGGVEADFDETDEAGIEDAETASFPPTNAFDALFDQISKSPPYRPYLSKVALLALEGCPTAIEDGLTVAWSCLDVITRRHALIADIDLMEPGSEITFHAYQAPVPVAVLTAALTCPANRYSNGVVDLHSAHDPSFVSAGMARRDGVRHYDVIFRQAGDIYRLVPARAKHNGAKWTVIKPDAGACIKED